jgi:uncharacterized protein (DUF2126 family)/transglutaminase-like putative cysteine protease
MSIRVALRHETSYTYDRPVNLQPQVIRLRPAPHCRTPIVSYSLSIDPAGHFLNWLQDPHGNFLGRMVLPERTRHLRVTVDLVADMTVINPFDFFVEEAAEGFPFRYDPALTKDLQPFLERTPAGPLLLAYLKTIDITPRRTIDFLVDLNRNLQQHVSYLIRMEPGVQTCEETLGSRSGSCRDSAWLLAQILRHFGLASRFVSGYLIQLAADVKPLDGPAGPENDFTDLHAWTEVFLPGAGWVGLDPTSGLLVGEGHLPLAATPAPETAAPISGALDACEIEFQVEMSVRRVHEDPRVTRPYTEEQWQAITRLGDDVDERLNRHDVRLTMGGEPTFVSIDDQEGEEWNTAAVGLAKQHLSGVLIRKLQQRFAPGALLHFGQGKWYPGESLPRWAYSCLWRRDGQPIWKDPSLLADLGGPGGVDARRAGEFLCELADRLEVDGEYLRPAYEDVWHLIEKEQQLPVDVDPSDFDLEDPEERRRLARILEHGVTRPVGYVLPLARAWWQARPRWTSGPWPFRSRRLFLIPGDSPIGLRLPLDSLPTIGPPDRRTLYTIDPFANRQPLPPYVELRGRRSQASTGKAAEVLIAEQSRQEANGDWQANQSEHHADHDGGWLDSSGVVHTAMCVEPRGGLLHVFMPPVSTLEDYLDLVAAIEHTAQSMGQQVVVEGYLPPPDPRLSVLKVTPDPGVIELNVHPARDWRELQDITQGVYECARESRLGTEKFQLDGKHSGTGGGNHIVLGGATPADSPFLRRPDLLRSVISYWNNHPSLSYVFASQFIGPTSQSPRVDEGRRDALYELEIACQQVPPHGQPPPWLVDRIFRNLLVDVTGNTHRAEICIDKLFSPDHAHGRLGLVELRSFEMPPHARMSLVQQLLVRALIARFWEAPYEQPLTRWGTAIHDRFMLPHFLRADLRDIAVDLSEHGIPFQADWFAPQLEFRCPRIGEFGVDDVQVELRTAIEPWYVLGEEPGGGGTARYVDSSVERMQVLVSGVFSNRFTVTCNGHLLPLRETATAGVRVAGVRYRAWQPPSCLHPTIEVHTPLVFDIVDQANGRSLAGATYHVGHPGGLNPQVYPVNALEAESRRSARFVRMGQTGGILRPAAAVVQAEFPCTLDLRRANDRSSW